MTALEPQPLGLGRRFGGKHWYEMEVSCNKMIMGEFKRVRKLIQSQLYERLSIFTADFMKIYNSNNLNEKHILHNTLKLAMHNVFCFLYDKEVIR